MHVQIRRYHLIKTRILAKAHSPQGKISPYRAPIAPFSDPENPAKRPDWTRIQKLEN